MAIAGVDRDSSRQPTASNSDSESDVERRGVLIRTAGREI